jgi:hypothetical protein
MPAPVKVAMVASQYIAKNLNHLVDQMELMVAVVAMLY